MPLGKEVLNTSESVSDFNVQKISSSIFDEVNYVASIFDMEEQISKEEADEVARKVGAHIATLNGNLKILTGPLIREMVCGELKGRNRDFYTRVGLSIADAFKIDNASSDVTHDNANQTKNAETKHKQKADQVAKEQALLTIPQHLSLAHMEADIHIHDLEYFTTRTFCVDSSVGIPLKDGDFINDWRFTQFSFGEMDYVTTDMCALTPNGWRKISRITRRKVEENEKLLHIENSSYRSVKVTKEHRIPLKENGKMVIKEACKLKVGDALYINHDRLNVDLRTEVIESISEVESSSEYVYDIILEPGKSEEDHTFFTDKGLLIHNCMDWDLRFFFYYGLDPDCTGKTNIATAAMQPTVALLHAAKILGSAQTNFAGGQGFYNFITFIAPYLEGLPYKEVKQLMQMFIFEISQTMVARGAQVVFSSVQLAPGIPKMWRDKPAVYKGVVWNGEDGNEHRVYGDFEKESRLAFRALMEVMHKGDAWGKLFNFPKPEIAFEKEFMADHEDDEYYERRETAKLTDIEAETPMTYSELYDLVMALTIKFGTPYYDNMIPEYRQSDGISCYQCCAFAFSAGADTKNFDDKMYFRNGEHFSMGSNQVVSTNTPRAAYNVPKGDFDALEAECKRLIMQAIEVHEFKRDWIKKLWYNGHIPFATQQLRHPKTMEVSPPAVDYEELVYTIGVVGMNEVSLYHTGYGLDHNIGLKLSIKLLNRLTDFVNEQGEERGIKLVLARTPAESAAQRFAVSDLMAYPEEATPCIQGDIETALAEMGTSRNLPIYYSNGTHLPVNNKVGIIDRMRREGKFFHVLDGGNIFHVWMGEEDPDPVALKEFIFNIINNTEIGYFTFTKDFSICEPCGKQMNGIKTTCDRCGSDDVKAYSRITGYIQDVSGWNAAKLQELKERTRISVN